MTTSDSHPTAAAEAASRSTGGPEAAGDSPKRHGDKLGVGRGPKSSEAEPSQTGDSPMRQGDKLNHAVEAAAQGAPGSKT